MPTIIKSPQVIVALMLFLFGIGALVPYWSAWPWSTIGIVLAFAGVLIMLLRDEIKKYGDDYSNELESNEKGKPFARRVHPYIFALGVPLVVLGAFYQIIGNPDDKMILRGENIPERIVYLPLNSKTKALDLTKLDKALNILQANQQAMDAGLRELTFPELLVVNCGVKVDCNCPPEYSRVPDAGGWNLNSGTKGDTITLCSRAHKYEHLNR